jgi:hypothetical protein
MNKEHTQPGDDPLAKLERALIEEFLERQGSSLSALRNLPPEEANELLRDASAYASGRLSEVETRAHLVGDLQSGVPPNNRRRPLRRPR